MKIEDIRIEDYQYDLPEERIALHPLEERDKCKLLTWSASAGIGERLFCEIPGLLPSDAILIYNNTKVINARMRFRKHTGASIEIFCLEPEAPSDYSLSFASRDKCSWLCFVGNSKKWKSGKLYLKVCVEGEIVRVGAERVGQSGNASVVEFTWDGDVTFSSIIEAAGEIPIPPYLNRPTEASDERDYQTVYSRIEGSVAAPTAGLHFTPAVLGSIDSRGIPRRELTLHVGAGTFQPVKSETIGGHSMHSEFISVPLSLIEELSMTSRRVVAVGTTSVRTLESLYHVGCMISQGLPYGEVPQWYPYSSTHPRLSKSEAMSQIVSMLKRNGADRLVASTRLMIAPGYRYEVVEGMVTNFHQPQSTLLLLVSAFTGGRWREIYEHALANDFRFLSYGDACLLL